MTRIFLVVSAYLLAVAHTPAQDIHFSQFNESPMNLNPAMTASHNDIRAILNYKDQWRSVTVPYQTIGASLEAKINRKYWTRVEKMTEIYRQSLRNLSGGISFFSDKAGDGKMGTLQANLSLASHVRLNEKNMLSAGLLGGFGQRSIDYTRLSWDSQYNGMSYDPNLPSNENFTNDKFFYPDFGAGMFWSYGQGEMYIRANNELKLNGGISLWHVNRPRYSFLGTSERLYMKYLIHGGALVGIKNTQLDIAPSFMIAQQGPANEILAGGLIRYNVREDSKYTGYVKGINCSIGAFYRNRDAVIATTLLEFGQWAIGMSYDVNTSSLHAVSDYRGGFEISLRFISPNPYLYQARSRIN